MLRNCIKIFTILFALFIISVPVMEMDAHARAGGGRSSGSRGGGSFSGPSRSYSRPATSPLNRTAPSQQGGGFMRSMAGGLVGGVLGGMLFRSLGFGGGGGGGGGGIGFFEIILLAGIGYMIYVMIRKRRAAAKSGSGIFDLGRTPETISPVPVNYLQNSAADDVSVGLANIRQMDPAFDEGLFNDKVMDIFFKIQGAWMHRDLTPVAGLLTGEMNRIFQDDIDTLKRERKINKLENIAVRTVDVEEAWQESGQDFITARIYANLLDYTTDDTTGGVISGSTTDPVKFEEYWTFTREVGNNPWKLSGINQS
ncbi:MAG: Tim44 domain-containing protein [Deltaproteobacteria bacterium]